MRPPNKTADQTVREVAGAAIRKAAQSKDNPADPPRNSAARGSVALM
jgi:hypothetical protein